VAVLVAAGFLLFRLGSDGLWEPWEMDRAAVARTIHEPSDVAVALGAEASQEGGLGDVLRQAGDEAGVALRTATPPTKGARGAAAGATTLTEALGYARGHVVAAVVLDATLFTSKLADPASWESAGARLATALDQTPAGRVLLVVPPGVDVAPEALASAVEHGYARYALARTVKPLSPRVPNDDAVDAALQEPATREALGLDRLAVLVAPDAPALQAALADAVSRARSFVQFKDGGETRAVEPLAPWAIAAAYSVLGVSELSTRLPGALFAIAALALLAWVTLRLYGSRVAVLAVAVLATTPVFFAQARSAVGEPEAIFSLTLVAAALLLEAHGRGQASARTVWGLLGAGLVVGFFAKGLFALMTYAALAGSLALVVGARERRLWLMALTAVVAFALAAWWVWTSPAASFAGQFRLTEKLFTAGPTAYSRNFDHVVNHVGFGTFPWAPWLLFAVGGLVFDASARRDRRLLTVFLWFGVPVVLMMATLKSHNQFLWPAAPAAALGVALFFDRVMDGKLRGALLALLVLLATVILVRELAKSPMPLGKILCFDPPFAKKGAGRFPDGVLLSATAVLVPFLAALTAVAQAGGLLAVVRKASALFARRLPLAIAAGSALFLYGFIWFGRTVSSFSVAVRLPTAGPLTPAQKGFMGHLYRSGDPAIVLAWVALALVLLPLLLRLVLPCCARAWVGLWRLWRRRKGAPDESSPWDSFERVSARLDTWLRRAAAGGTRRLPASWAWWLMGGSLVGLAVSTLVSVGTPPGYWGAEVFTVGRALAVLVLAAAAFVAAWRWGRAGVWGAAVFALGLVSLYVAAKLGRDAGLVTWYTLAWTAGAAVGFAGIAAPILWRSWAHYAFGAGLLGLVAFLLLTVPLLDRWETMLPLIYPEGGESLWRYLLYRSRVSWLLYGGLLGLALNAPRERLIRAAAQGRSGLAALVTRVADWGLTVLDRGPIAVGALLLGAVVFSASVVWALFPSLTYNVSQKHIVDTYRAAEHLGSRDMGDRIYRHGSFAVEGRGDANFYTADIPEVRDRDTALRVLLGDADQAARVETPRGTDVRLLPGFDPKNLGHFAHPPERGVLTGAAPGKAVDATKQWTPHAFQGRVLVDSAGKVFPIEDNTDTELILAGGGRPQLVRSSPRRSVYAIVDPDLPNPRATATEDTRYYFLLPANDLSSLNYAFRKLSGGRHIPVIDGRSYRVVLAASRLREGEEQQNRYAIHTMTRAAFDKLQDPKIHRSEGDYLVNFDDKIWVIGYKMDEEVVSRGKTFTLTTYYQSVAPVRSSYEIFMHIDRSGTSNRIHSDHWPLNLTKNGEHNKGCTGCFRTDQWMPGDVIEDRYTGDVPIGTPSGTQELWMGLYLPGGGTRLKVKDWDRALAKHDGNNRVRIGSFQVR